MLRGKLLFSAGMVAVLAWSGNACAQQLPNPLTPLLDNRFLHEGNRLFKRNIDLMMEREPNSKAITIITRIEKVKVLGSTAFSAEELNQAVSPFENRDLPIEQIEDIGKAIGELYSRQGYVAVIILPAQEEFLSFNLSLTPEIVVQVREASLESIEIEGLKKIPETYVRSRLEEAGTTPLNVNHLDLALKQLQQEPFFSKVQGELINGSTPEQKILKVTVEEAPDSQ